LPCLVTLSQDEYGKYGIIQQADRYRKAREFEAWLTEVKRAPSVVGGAQWEIMEYFKEFMEDYNTATLPHQKYYNFESWEALDYERKQALEAKKGKRTRTQFDDDEALKAARKMTREQKAQQRLNEVRSEEFTAPVFIFVFICLFAYFAVRVAFNPPHHHLDDHADGPRQNRRDAAPDAAAGRDAERLPHG